jgi:hypothetical protein
MALRIFDTDPEAKPKPKVSFDDGTIGRVHSGKMVPNPKAPGQMIPESLDHWEFSTGDIDVSNALSELFRAPIVDTQSESENFLRIEDTGTDTLEIILHSISSDMKQWNMGKLVHHCDGVTFISGEDYSGRDVTGQPCGCPKFFAERKAAAKAGRGPKPSIKFVFALADAPELGTFNMQTGSWDTAAALSEYDDRIADAGSYPVVAKLSLELVEFVIKKGPNAGTHVEYRYPVLKRIRSYDDANAE